MASFRIKNYKGNLIESLKNFQKKHPSRKITEAIEEEDSLKITTEDASSDEETSEKLWDETRKYTDDLEESIRTIKKFIDASRKAIDFDKSHNIGNPQGISESDSTIKVQEKAITALINSFQDIFYPDQFK